MRALFLIVLFAGNVHAQSTAQEFADAAYKLWDNAGSNAEDQANAILKMQKAAELEPTNFKWVYNLAVFHYSAGVWDKAKENFEKASELAANDADRSDAINWLEKSQVKEHQARIEDSRNNKHVVGNENQDFVKFSMKEMDLVQEWKPDSRPPVIPQIAVGENPQPILDYLKANLPNYNAQIHGEFILVCQGEDSELERHYQRGIKDFYNNFMDAYFSKKPERYITALISTNPGKLVDAVKIIDPEIRLRAYAPFVGLYIPVDNLIVATVGGGYGTLLHEMMHALIQNESDSTPKWLEEVMASLYERCIWKDGRLTPLANWRTSLIWRNIESLDGLERVINQNHIQVNEFAELRFLGLYLDREGVLPDFYKEATAHPQKPFKLKSTLNSFLPNFTEQHWQSFAHETKRAYDAELLQSSDSPGYAELKSAQRSLNEILNLQLDVDGFWGNQTQLAVEQFQKKFGLVVTGKLDSKTLKMIEQKHSALAVKK